MKKTLYEKIWDEHIVHHEDPIDHSILYIDLQLIHEVTSPQAFDFLREHSIPVYNPERCLATVDHVIPTKKENGQLLYLSDKEKQQVQSLERNCKEFGIRLFDESHSKQGIVHVMAPENGFTQPGMTIVCGDSHTSTHGAFAAYAFGIGTSEVGHVLATQCLMQKKAKTMGIRIHGELNEHVFAKDIILYIISKIGTKGGTGYVIEYLGPCIDKMSMDERMTICNMSIEAGAKAGLIAADDVTFDYLKERLSNEEYESKINHWKKFTSDKDAVYDSYYEFDASDIYPMITYGSNPETGIAVFDRIPDFANEQDLDYMDFDKNESLLEQKIDMVFIGSCTNGRLSDLRIVAKLLEGKTISEHVQMLIVPGSYQTKIAAEKEGLDKIFIAAGAEWREAGCSMCLGMNGDTVKAYDYCVSTSNRNFKGRQGVNSRTLLASPYLATLAAIHGKIVDTRSLEHANEY